MAAGKKSKKSSSDDKKAKPNTAAQESSLLEPLRRARIALETSQMQMLSLHRNWRTQLQRLSLLAMFLILKQSSIPAYDCLDQIKEWNHKITNSGSESDNNIIGDWEVGIRILGDSTMEIFSVLCCLSLLWLLHQPLQGDDFSTLPFKLSVALVPLIVGSYYSDPMVGCMTDKLGNYEGKPRTFPVTLILLMVCFGSLYMMQFQQRDQTENLKKVQKLQNDLLGSSKTKKET